ncbi:MAG: hypothetical protein H0W78_07015 [Planctomycetes bacterium]|nr:hypothetical protein [Planctomycetota bacterium]
MKLVITALVEQHAAEIAALIMLRSHAVESPRYHARHLAQLDERIAMHLDGLREAGVAAGAIVGAAVAANPEIGEATTVVVQALLVPGEVRQHLSAAFTALAPVAPALWHRAGIAVRWVDRAAAQELLTFCQQSDDHRHHLLALGAAMQVRQAPAGLIVRALADPRTSAAAADTAGVLGERDWQPALRGLLNSDDLATRFAAARALALRGGESAAWRVLHWFSESRSPLRHAALALAGRCAAPGSHAGWLHPLMSDRARRGDALVLAGAWGDPLVLPWLARCLRDPVHARCAGAMVSLITGVDLDDEGLSRAVEDDVADDGPNDDPADDHVDPDPDHDLSWPDAEAVDRWLAAHPLPVGVRHLAGRAIDEAACVAIIADGFQPQRQAAAVELVRLRGGVLTAF